jgi:starvation-inducible outer membrane lipoprotein
MEVAMRMPTALVLLSATMLAGCVGTPPALDRIAHSAANDPDYIAQVEAVARRRNVDVVWVNPPRVRDRRY